jgi:hypothetical protein
MAQAPTRALGPLYTNPYTNGGVPHHTSPETSRRSCAVRPAEKPATPPLQADHFSLSLGLGPQQAVDAPRVTPP